MASLSNLDGNVELLLNLLAPNVTDWTDWNLERPNFENWIAFTFSLRVESEEYSYPIHFGATLSLLEVENFIVLLTYLIEQKKYSVVVKDCEFTTLERYFDIKFSDTLEEGLLELEIWLTQGVMTKGISYGFDRGFRFTVELTKLELFNQSLADELSEIGRLINLG